MVSPGRLHWQEVAGWLVVRQRGMRPGGGRLLCADVHALPPTALCEGDDACGVDEICVRPGVCLCKPGFFGADCSSRKYFPRAQPSPSPFCQPGCSGGCRASPSLLILAISFPSQAAPSGTGVLTASGPARATPTGAATRRAGTAPATPTTGESSASSPASAVPTVAATPSSAPAVANRAGGRPPARSNASATPPAPTATHSPATAAACWAGGAGGAASNAPATSRPAPRRRASANARLGFGGWHASDAVIACTVPAVPSVGTAAAILATRAGAAGTPVRQGNTGFSVRTGELGAAGGIQRVPRGYSQTLGGGGAKSSWLSLSLSLGRETYPGGVEHPWLDAASVLPQKKSPANASRKCWCHPKIGSSSIPLPTAIKQHLSLLASCPVAVTEH